MSEIESFQEISFDLASDLTLEVIYLNAIQQLCRAGGVFSSTIQ
jgi:hypothetical protein